MSTLFLGAMIGWYLVIVSLFLLIRPQQARAAMTDVMAQRGLLFVLAIITLILGLIMVLIHNIWVPGWPVIITLFSWLVLLSGLWRLFFPDSAIRTGQYFLNNPTSLIVTAVIFLIIGLFLLLKVYVWMF